MHFNTKELQLQYKGFIDTFFLKKTTLIKPIKKTDYHYIYINLSKVKVDYKIRLGKLVELFVFNQLNCSNDIELIAENIQIQDDKITLGELDCLFLLNQKPIHMEIVYKFYLYDASVSNSETKCWIGPNRKDSLFEKLTNLNEKQFPILYHEKTLSLLDNLQLNRDEIQQELYFKAQLFLHLNEKKERFEYINEECIEGFYIYKNELILFENCKFFLPTKHNWLVKPHTNVSWLNFTEFNKELMIYMDRKHSPMCWLKKPNGELVKFFVVWW